MGNFEKFEEQLPSKEKFYSLLRVKKISDKEYDYVLKVRNKFQTKTMKDYCVLYLKCDALLLVDVFEKFRNNSLKNHGLCRSHCLSAPDLSWDAILKMTKVELQVITDSDMYICFKKGMRGGVSYISNRYSKINNKYLKSYDLKHESKHTTYLDSNYLYGCAMFRFLPTSGFKWIVPKKCDLNKNTSNSSKGCVLEVDLEYPKELQ